MTKLIVLNLEQWVQKRSAATTTTTTTTTTPQAVSFEVHNAAALEKLLRMAKEKGAAVAFVPPYDWEKRKLEVRAMRLCLSEWTMTLDNISGLSVFHDPGLELDKFYAETVRGSKLDKFKGKNNYHGILHAKKLYDDLVGQPRQEAPITDAETQYYTNNEIEVIALHRCGIGVVAHLQLGTQTGSLRNEAYIQFCLTEGRHPNEREASRFVSLPDRPAPVPSLSRRRDADGDNSALSDDDGAGRSLTIHSDDDGEVSAMAVSTPGTSPGKSSRSTRRRANSLPSPSPAYGIVPRAALDAAAAAATGDYGQVPTGVRRNQMVRARDSQRRGTLVDVREAVGGPPQLPPVPAMQPPQGGWDNFGMRDVPPPPRRYTVRVFAGMREYLPAAVALVVGVTLYAVGSYIATEKIHLKKDWQIEGVSRLMGFATFALLLMSYKMSQHILCKPKPQLLDAEQAGYAPSTR